MPKQIASATSRGRTQLATLRKAMPAIWACVRTPKILYKVDQVIAWFDWHRIPLTDIERAELRARAVAVDLDFGVTS